ncbi:CamS family sex pheromone protein [Sporolactobacillus sp. THM7-4]|nr:CamS family sex pheromone protein [Sporolactobacillus sp. THM7-4]
MRRKRLGAAALMILCLQLAVSGCSFNGGSAQNVVKKNNGGTETAKLIPTSNSKDYQTLRPMANDPMRGYINYGVSNRVDVDQMETGLMEMSKSVYKPDQYVFQSGQYLQESDINGMLYREGQEKNKSKGTPPGLNPPLGKGKTIVQKAQNSPKYLNYVLEQDYLKKAGNGKYELGGVSLAVSLNSVYTERIADSKGMLHPIVENLDIPAVKRWGLTKAQSVVQRVRSVRGLGNVPIFLTLYITSPPDSLVPGSFFAKTEIAAGSANIQKWDYLDQANVLFPSDTASSHYKADLDKFNRFKSDVQNYYPDFVGVIGKAYYENKNLSDLTININIKFFDDTEVLSFTNYVTSIVNTRFGFSRDVPVHIYITSGDVQEALIERTPDMNDPYVTIFHH